MMKVRRLSVWLSASALAVLAAIVPTAQTPAPAQPPGDPLVRALAWRNIGNANLIGRISAIAALDNDFTHVVVGSASGGVFKSTNAGTSWTPIFDNYGAASIGDVAIFQRNPDIIWVGTGEECGRNSATWGDGVYKSIDGGKTFTHVGLKDTFNVGSIVLHPTDPNIAYVAAVGYNHLAISPFNDKETYHYNINFMRSKDGGKTLEAANGGTGGHCWHAIWLDPHNKKRFWTGSDGGLNLTHDDGETWLRFENLNVTQYYDVAADMRDPYWVCGGLQDAGSSCGPSQTRAQAIYTSDWMNLTGGDGYYAAMDPTDWRTVYTESQPGTSGGNVTRTDVYTRQSQSIRPRKGVNIVNYDDYITPETEKRQKELNWGEAPPPPPPGQRGGPGRGGGRGGGRGATMGAFRWNWSAPFTLSEFNPRTIYLGANHVFKSSDRGDTWRIISPDLTKNMTDRILRKSGGLTPDEDPGGGAEFYGTIVSLAESPIEQGVVWVGSDDGNVQVTRNDGASWQEVGKNLPGLPSPDLYISKIEPSHHARGTAYLSVDGHEAAISKPSVFKTTDYGKTWTSTSSNLPDGQPV